MNGPNRLWSGDWSEESAAARARMAQRRGQRSALADDPTEPLDAPAPPPPAPPSAPSPARQLLAATAVRWRAAASRVRARVAARRGLLPRGLRARLIAIALLAGLGGAAVTIAVEAASPAATQASQGSAQAYLGVELGTAGGGAVVEYVEPGTPAAGAGLEPGDVITAIDGRPVSDGNAAAGAIKAGRPGEQITLGIDRLGQQITITATLGTRPANTP